MPAEYKDIIAALPHLTSRQLLEVRKRVGALIAVTKAEQGAKEVADDWLLEGILAELRRQGLGTVIPPLQQLKGLQAYKTYSAHSVQIRFWCEEQIPHLTQVEKQAYGLLIGKLLAKYVARWAEVNLRVLLEQVKVVPEAIEAAFPGYAQAGLLKVVIRRHL